MIPEGCPSSAPRPLVAIPAFNEASTIESVIASVQTKLPNVDLLIVNDGSLDDTGRRAELSGAVVAWHRCNLGYGRALQTALCYAQRHEYSCLIALDADGQHQASILPKLLEAFTMQNVDVLIGSRYLASRCYDGSPFGRRLGMQFFSWLTWLVSRQRIFDTTSGMKIFRRTVFDPLTRWHFVDFHAEAIVYLLRLGYQVGEYPITVTPRSSGRSMYSAISSLEYPAKTGLMVALALIQAHLVSGERK